MNEKQIIEKFEQVHGLRIIMQIATSKGSMTRSGRYILVDRGPTDKLSRYITAWQGRDEEASANWDEEWSSGHYFEGFAEAFDDFIARIGPEVRSRIEEDARGR